MGAGGGPGGKEGDRGSATVSWRRCLALGVGRCVAALVLHVLYRISCRNAACGCYWVNKVGNVKRLAALLLFSLCPPVARFLTR